MPDVGEPAEKGGLLESISGELTEIKNLLAEATIKLEQGNLSEAREAMVSARDMYEKMSAQVAVTWKEGPDEQRRLLVLRLDPMNRAIHRLERRIAAHGPPR